MSFTFPTLWRALYIYYLRWTGRLREQSVLFNDGKISGKAQVCGDAWVSGNARVRDHAHVSGYAYIQGNACICDHVKVDGSVTVKDNAIIRGYVQLIGVTGTYVTGFATINGNSILEGDVNAILPSSTIKDVHWWSDIP